MRSLLSWLSVLSLSVAPALADDKKPADKKPADSKKDDKKVEVDADKLLGKWVTPIPKGPGAAAFEKNAGNIPAEFFGKDGKYELGPASGKGPNLGGKYTLEGDKLTVTMDGGGGPATVYKRTVKKLTDTELVYVEGKTTHTLNKGK